MMVACAALTAGAATDWADISRYAGSNEALKSQPASSTRVVFIGNSITDFWASTHPAFFSDNDFVGRGISGQTTYQFLVRFRDDVVGLKPAAVVINGGTNDIAENNYAYNEDRTFGNIASMSEIASANGIKVILASVLPSSRFNWNPGIADVADKIASLNSRIKAYADEMGYPYIDYYSELVYGSERSLNPAYTNDGVHPTAAGYDIMESVALPVIRSVVKIDELPESASLTGGALEEGSSLELVKRGLGSFDIYTKLKGGETFTIESEGNRFGIADGTLVSDGVASVDKSGVYCIKVNFGSKTASVEEVTGLGLYYCILDSREIELAYAGNGVFKGYGEITLTNFGWGDDTRYRFAMDRGGKLQWWGPVNDGEDSEPNGTAEYYYMKETNPGNQWDNKWKVISSKADSDKVLKGMEVIVEFNGPNYTHMINYGVPAPSAVENIKVSEAEGAYEYYNLQGTPLSGEPKSGVYIRRNGTVSEKILVR